MHKGYWLAAAALVALGGCSRSEPEGEAASVATADATAPQNKFGFREALVQKPLLPEITGSGDSAVSPDAPAQSSTDASASRMDGPAQPSVPGTPQIAYAYSYGFRVPTEGIAPLQQVHADLCEKKGPQVCRVLSLSQDGNEGDYGYGNLHLEVAADKARVFGRELASAAESVDAQQISTSISGEDLSKQIVDTEARLRARSLLRDRLMEVLRTRQGSVADLVAAERGVADVNEEIDQAQSWLAEMRGRVTFSKVDISYNSQAPSSGGFTGPIREAFGAMGAILGRAIGFLIVAATALLPFAVLLFGIVRLRRRMGWMWPRRRRPDTSTAHAEE